MRDDPVVDPEALEGESHGGRHDAGPLDPASAPPGGPGAAPERGHGSDVGEDLDWFGFPLERPRDPVPCPRCGAGFTDKVAYAAHLVEAHDARPERRRRRPAPADRPALGRDPRSPLAQRLRTVPLVLVLAVNVAGILATFGTLGALDPPWWRELHDQPWSFGIVVPMLWPTALFLALRGID